MTINVHPTGMTINVHPTGTIHKREICRQLWHWRHFPTMRDTLWPVPDFFIISIISYATKPNPGVFHTFIRTLPVIKCTRRSEPLPDGYFFNGINYVDFVRCSPTCSLSMWSSFVVIWVWMYMELCFVNSEHNFNVCAHRDSGLTLIDSISFSCS